MLFIGSFCGTSCVEVWQNMKPGYGSFPNSSVGDTKAQRVFDIHQCFLVFSTRGLVGIFLLLSLHECLCILFELVLGSEVTVTRIMTLLSTVVASNVIHISPGSLILLFSVTCDVSSFTTL